MPKWRSSQVAKCLAALAVAGTATALLRGQDRPQFRSGVDIARIDVAALDGSRRPVRGLTAGDFTLRVDGKVQSIRTFAAIDVPSAASPTATLASWTREIAPDVQTNAWPDEGRLVVIFFDRSIPPGPKMTTARVIAAAAVKELGPHDLGAVTSTRGSAAQNFTADRARLLRTIERVPAGSGEGADDAITSSKVFEFEPGTLAQFRAHEACYCNVCVLEQLQQMADALRDVPQRKLLLFIGSALTLDARDVDPVGRVMKRPDEPDSPVYACAEPLKRARTSLYTALERSNVTIHSLDPSGLQPTPGTDAASSLRGRQISDMIWGFNQVKVAQDNQIRVLPDLTGGRVVTNTNTPQNFVPAVIAESSAYYMIGFDSPQKAVDIEVKANRRGVNVRTQKMFDPNPRAVSEPRAAGPATLAPAAMAVTGVLPARGIPMSTSVVPLGSPNSDEATLIVVTGLDPQSRERAPASDAAGARVDLVVGIFDPRARPLEENRFSLELNPASSGEAGKHYDVASPIVLKPGTYEIRVGAATADGRTGSSVSYVDIPNFQKDRISLSGVALTTMPSGATIAVDRASELLPFLPTTRRTFRQSETIRAFLQVYQGGSDPVSAVGLAVAILDTHGREMLKANEVLGPERFKTDRTAAYGTDLPLSGLAAGEYLLSFGASEGKNQTRRDVRFTVQ